MTKESIIDPKFDSLTPDFREAIEKCMDEYANDKIIEELESLLKSNCYDEYLRDLISERIKEYKNTSKGLP